MKALNNPVILLSEIEYTELATQALSTNFSTLKGRERQFLLLLMREDKLSRQACERLLDKVDLISLAAKGYIVSEALDQASIEAAKQDNPLQAKMGQADKYHIESTELIAAAKNESRYTSEASSRNELNPILHLAAGNF